MSYLEEAHQRIVRFNKMIGAKDLKPFSDEWWEKIALQTKLLKEEASESFDKGGEVRNIKEVVDGAIDVIVVNGYLIEMLEKAGVDVKGAIAAINDNNDSKTFQSYHEAIVEKDRKEELDGQEYYVDSSYVDGIEYFCIKRMDGKVVKKVGFKGVDLTPFIPKEVL